MSVQSAMLTLAWGCLAVLTLAMAGMLRQLRELQAEVIALRADQGMQPWRATVGRQMPQLAGAGPAVLLVLDPGCGLCDDVQEPFTRLPAEYPGVRFEVLSPSRLRPHWADAPNIRSRVDAALVAELDLPWAPALLHVDSDGTVLAAQPVVAAQQLSEQVAGLLNTAMVQQGAR
ncbi:MAG TPA: hypothetical protein VFA63_20030 [Pseudonocardiaceae bacterium]|jgi:hypothetical protein|nr:hypothetical protein [Pseudonocardiaceae bacterium]